MQKLALPKIAGPQDGGQHIGREAQVRHAYALHRLLLARALYEVGQNVLVHVEAVTAVAAAAQEARQQPLGDEGHEPVAELRELALVVAHEGVGDDLAVIDDADGLYEKLQPVAVEDEGLRRNAHVVLFAVGEDVLDEVLVEVADLDAVQPVRVVHAEGLGIGQDLARDVDSQHLAVGVLREGAEDGGEVLVGQEHVDEVGVELLLLYGVAEKREQIADRLCGGGVRDQDQVAVTGAEPRLGGGGRLAHADHVHGQVPGPGQLPRRENTQAVHRGGLLCSVIESHVRDLAVQPYFAAAARVFFSE